jgi:hypothetical protein
VKPVNPPRALPLRAAFAALALLLSVAALSLTALACGKPPLSSHGGPTGRAADKQLIDIPATTVSGKVHGREFKLVDARVRVETMRGRERVDVLLSDSSIKRCGLPLATHDRRVWLRWQGKPVLDGTPVRVEVGRESSKRPNGSASPLSAHYETLVDGQWLGHGGGAALLSLRDEGFGKYKGAVWVCFDDAEHSCVSGQFEARACRSELDVDDSVWGAARLDAKYPAVGSQ